MDKSTKVLWTKQEFYNNTVSRRRLESTVSCLTILQTFVWHVLILILRVNVVTSSHYQMSTADDILKLYFKWTSINKSGRDIERLMELDEDFFTVTLKVKVNIEFPMQICRQRVDTRHGNEKIWCESSLIISTSWTETRDGERDRGEQWPASERRLRRGLATRARYCILSQQRRNLLDCCYHQEAVLMVFRINHLSIWTLNFEKTASWILNAGKWMYDKLSIS